MEFTVYLDLGNGERVFKDNLHLHLRVFCFFYFIGKVGIRFNIAFICITMNLNVNLQISCCFCNTNIICELDREEALLRKVSFFYLDIVVGFNSFK